MAERDISLVARYDERTGGLYVRSEEGGWELLDPNGKQHRARTDAIASLIFAVLTDVDHEVAAHKASQPTAPNALWADSSVQDQAVRSAQAFLRNRGASPADIARAAVLTREYGSKAG